MKRSTAALILLSCLFINQSPIQAQYIHTNGNKIVDGNNNDIYFRGMNLGNWLLWEGYLMMGDYNYRTHTQFFNSVKSAFGGNLTQAIEFEHQWRMNYVTDYSIAELKGLGFNAVRVPFHFNLFWDYNTNAPSNRGFQYIDRVVSYCRSRGMYVLLDMHAAPGYQNPGDHSDNGNSNSSQPRGSVTFWDGNNVNIASQVWKHIANYYKNEPVIWGYDLINEPVPQPGREFELMGSMKTMRDAIRQVDNNHIIVAEGSWWGSDMQKLDWMDGETQSKSGINYRWDNNLVYQTHHYSSDVSALNGRLAMCNKLNVPMILGEYGESDNTNLRNMTNWCIDNQVDYFPWSFKKMSHNKCLWTIQPNGAYNNLKNYINNGGNPPSNIYNDMISFCQNNIANGSAGLNWDQGWYDGVKYTGPVAPVGCGSASAKSIPGTIEAEAFCDMSGLQAENCSEGGQNLGYADAGDWADYRVNVSTAGTYTVNFRVASANSGTKSIQLKAGANTATASFTGTGGWQTWTTVSADIVLSAGTQTVRLNFQTGGININWIQLTAVPNAWSTRIQAESYFQMAGLQTENTSDTGGGLNVGWIDNGDWAGYNVTIPSNGVYTVSYRVSSPNSSGQIRLEAFGGGAVYGTRSVTSTGGWQTWITVSHTIQLNGGAQQLALAFPTGGFNLNYFDIKSGSSARVGLDEDVNESVGQSISVYPNPTHSELNLTGISKEYTNAVIYSLEGRQQMIRSLQGEDQIKWDVSSLEKGIFLIRMNGNGVSPKSIRFVKK